MYDEKLSTRHKTKIELPISRWQLGLVRHGWGLFDGGRSYNPSRLFACGHDQRFLGHVILARRNLGGEGGKKLRGWMNL
ncbi:hypothetical protein Hanom_Chr00s077651g01791931 [Helianthus anomalus]